ncbi:MAG TPA: S9 family peptidase [Bryobacteraceae bacterium]|nr:S9 family peptidase [Bryobacteraceae bacterium]
MPNAYIKTAILFICAAISLSAQNSQIDQVLHQLEQVHTFSDVTISPDGRWITYIEPAARLSEKSELYLLDWKNATAHAQRVTPANDAAHPSGVAWSPDSKQFAFFASKSTQNQIFAFPVSSASTPDAKARRLTNLNGYATDIRWSRDGKRLAFLYAENGGGGGPLEAVPAQTGPVESEIHNQRLTIMNADASGLQQLTPGDLNIYEYDWSPDDKRFAALAAPGPADNNWWIAKLYTIDAASGRMNVLYAPPKERQLAVPRWSPDGVHIAFIGGLMSDQGFNGGDIFLMSSDGGAPRNLTPNRKSSPSGLSWQDPGKIAFTEYVDGASAISTLSIASATAETLWKGNEGIHEDGNFPDFSLAADGWTSALIRSSWQQPPEVWGGPIGDWHQITHANSNQQPHWGKAESVAWKDRDFHAQGWLLYPENFDPGKHYPMVVEIHGGPSNLKTPSWPSPRFDMSIMAGLGYFVFFPNPRGSYGEGETFTQANVKDFGGGDLRDILTGVDAVLKQVPVDNDRIGVTGWSYGGYMTMWAVTQTNRFRAAVAGAGIADWLSYYGENSIDQWMTPFFGTSVYDNPAVYAKSSPITYIKQVKTPTLVVVGQLDGECPAPQSFEFWHALKDLNVPTQLVVYAGEGHAFHDPKDRLDVLHRALEWFDKYLAK